MTNSKKPLYQPWNEEEFRGDMRVISMTPLQRYLYRTLLQAAFFCSTRPYLPDNDEQLFQLSWCESQKNWHANKSEVLKMFSSITVSGVKVLRHKRVVSDWQRIASKRKLLSKAGQNGGVANATANAQARLKPGSSREVKGSKDKRSEEEREMSLKTSITDKARLILGIRLNPQSNDWKEIASLGRVYGNREVEQAFEEWAATRRGEIVPYPLSEFLKIADGLLTGVIEISESEEFVNFLGALYKIGNQAFAAKHRVVVKELYKRYGEEELLSAYREFFSNLNTYQESFAVRDFCEGGAEGIIGARKLNQKEQQDVTKTLADLAERGAREAQRNLPPEEEEIIDLPIQ